MENYQAEAVFCEGGKKCSEQGIKGKWTSIYDQAFNIELENGLRLTANFRYNIKPDITKDPFFEAKKNGVNRFMEIQSGDYEKFNSECSKTMVGFIH